MSRILTFPWDQSDPLARTLPESERANQALRMYAALGSGRPPVTAFYKIYGERLRGAGGAQARVCVISTFTGWCMDYRWIKRLAAFDQLESLRAVEDLRTQASDDRRTRIKLLTAFRGKIVQALGTLDTAAANWADISTALRLVSQELRTEYGEALAEATADAESAAAGPTVDDGLAGLSDAELAALVRNLDTASGARAD